MPRRYRPLAGISCFYMPVDKKRSRTWLPSPRGDKLFHYMTKRSKPSWSGYRPLAGISCFRLDGGQALFGRGLPSPRGDKLFPGRKPPNRRTDRLPSPRGDKLFLHLLGRLFGRNCYRPLAGISCFQVPQSDFSGCWRYRPLAGISCFLVKVHQR